jgi:prevent-host-death family protein
MDVISVRDLRNHTGRVLRRVEAGETLIVQSNRRSVAQIAPLQERPVWMPAQQFFARVLAQPADSGLRAELAELQPDFEAVPGLRVVKL